MTHQQRVRHAPDRQRAHVQIVCALVVLLVCGLSAKCALANDAPMQAPDVRPPDLAIAGFSLTAEHDPRDAWMPVAVEETLTWRLRRVPGLVVVPSVRVFQGRRELQDSDTQQVDWAKVARLLGAKNLLTGKCSGTPDAASLYLTLSDLGSNELRSDTTTIPAGRLFDVLDAATRWTLERLAAGTLDETTKKTVFAPPARSPSALEYYAKAVAAARTENARDTAYYAEEALTYDPHYRPALALMAQVELRLSGGARNAAAVRLQMLSELARRDNDPLHRGEAELARGLLLALEGNFAAARQRYENALATAYESRNPYGQIAAINSICDLYQSPRPPPGADLTTEDRQAFVNTNYRRAAEWQEVILQILAALHDVIGEPSTANKLAILYERLGDTQRALAIHKRTLDAAVRTASLRNQATAWMFIGQWHRREQNWAEALDATSRCLALADQRHKPVARVALAGIYHAMGKLEDALGQYESVYNDLAAGDDFANQFVALREIATLRMQLNQREKAIAALQEALDIAHILKLPEEAALRDRLERWQRDAQP